MTPVIPLAERERHTRALLASYEKTDGLINRSDLDNLPSKRAVGRICEELLRLIFPGFHDDDAVREGELPCLTGERLGFVLDRLEDQLRKGVRVGNPGKPTGRTPPILKAFVRTLPEVRELLQTDVEEAFNGDPSVLHRDEIILSFPYIEAIAIQRMAHLLYKEGAPIIPRMMTEWVHGRTGIDIHPGAQIGSHFFIDHGTGVVVGETCRIGNHVKLYHGVTLGARSFVKDEEGNVVKGGKRHPDVDDGVTIYPNATVLGGKTVIGAHATIGANVFLMQSVPPHSLVLYEEKQLSILNKLVRRPQTEPEWLI